MPRAWIKYAILAGVRCLTFYLALAGVQYLFDGKVNWLANLFPASAFAVLLTYMQARWAYLRTLQKAKAQRK